MFDSALVLLCSLWISGCTGAGALFLKETRDQLIAIGISALAIFPTIFVVITILVEE